MSRGRSAAASRSAGGRAAEAAPVFAALGDPTRLGLVDRLCKQGPLSIVRLTEGTAVTRQGVTKHLQALADAGLVHDRWVGRERVFELETRRLELARRHLDAISRQWDGAIARLRALVEEE